MEYEKKVWLLEQYAQKTWTVSLVLSQEAARAGEHGKGFAVVAGEARVLSKRLYDLASEARFGQQTGIFNAAAEMALMQKFLSVNAALETAHAAFKHTDFNIPKSMSVFAEELRIIADELNELSGRRVFNKPFLLPEPAEPVGVSGITFFYSIGGYPFYEDILNIEEICYLLKTDTENERVEILGPRDELGRHAIPCLNFYKRFGLEFVSFNPERRTTMIIRLAGGSSLAVPIDDMDINPINLGKKGVPVPPQEGNIFAPYAKECWNAVDGGQFIALDFNRIMNG
jgi:hypothetical protein